MADINYKPASWGGTNTGKDYEFLMEGSDLFSPLNSLVGEHMIDTPSQNLTEPTLKRYTKLVNGRIVDREEVVRQADQLSLTMNINFGSGIETPLLQNARRAKKTTIAANRLCADAKQGHIYIWEKGTLNPPTRVNAVIAIEDNVLAQWQTEFRTDIEYILKELGVFVARTGSSDYYDVTFLDDDCLSASGNQYSDLIAVGGDGGVSDPIVITRTSDRFATVSTPTTPGGAPNGSIGTRVISRGNDVLIAFADKAKSAAATSTAGGTLFSVNGGDVFTIDANITAPIYGLAKFGSVWLAAGGVGAGAPYLASSENGVNWTAITSGAFPVADVFTDIAVDEAAGKIYLTTLGGDLFVGVFNGGAFTFSQLTISGTPTSLFSVAVLGKDILAITGTSGYVADSLDAGATWVQRAFGTTSSVNRIAGIPYRQIAVAGTRNIERSWLTLNRVQNVAIEGGASLTGALQSVTHPAGEPNFFCAVTSGGDIVFVRDFSPYS